MTLFDIQKYQIPNLKDVDMKQTKKNFEIFMTAYGAAREKVGKSRMPSITQSYHMETANSDKESTSKAEGFLIEREKFMPEYKELHSIFGLGYLAISNPLKQDGTERRRQIFVLRYVYGIGIQEISERTYLGKTAIVEESQLALMQFCKATELLVYHKVTKPLVSGD